MIQYRPILSFLDQFPNSQGTWNSRWSQRTWWASNVSPPWIYLSDPRPFPTAFGSPNCRRSDSPPGDSWGKNTCIHDIVHVISLQRQSNKHDLICMFNESKYCMDFENWAHISLFQMSNFASLKLSEMTSRSSALMIWGATRPSSKKLFASFSNSPGETTSRHHSRHVWTRKCRGWMVVCWDASRACDHYDAGGAIPNFIVLGLADVNQDPCSWMDLSWCNIWDSTCCKGFWLHLATISIGTCRTWESQIANLCKLRIL